MSTNPAPQTDIAALGGVFADPRYTAHDAGLRDARAHLADLTTRRNRAKGDTRKALTKRVHAAEAKVIELGDAQRATLATLCAEAGIAV